MKRAVLFLLVCLLTTFGFAQDLKTFTITPPGEGGFSYFLLKGDDYKEPILIEGKSVEVAAPEDPNGYQVIVIDTAINRAAAIDLVKVLKTKTYEPKSDQFNLIYLFEVQFEPEEGIIPVGNVTFKTGDKSWTTFMTDTDKNVVRKSLLPAKPITVELDYEVDGDKNTAKGTYTPEASAGPSILKVAVPAKFPLEAITPPAGETPEKSTTEKPAPSGDNPLMGFVRLLIGLIVVGGLGYGAYWYYKNNQQVVEKLAAQSGLTAQSQGASDPTGALPPDPVKQELQKIDLGGGSPLSVSMERGSGGEAISSVTPVAKNPRLVKADGNIHLIQEGTATVGREAADLTLDGESSVSRKHAEIIRSGDQITINDSGSTNGTYINGTKIAAPTVLQPGDTVQFGAVGYRYEE